MRQIATLLFIILCFSPSQARELILQAGHSDYVVDVAFTPQGDQAVTAGQDGAIKVWDRDNGKVYRTFRTEKQKSDRGYLYTVPVHSVDVSVDGKWVASLDGEREVSVRDLESGKLTQSTTLQGKDGDRGGMVRFFPAGQALVATSFDQSVTLIDSAKNEVFRFTSDVKTLAIRPDGKAIAVGLEDGSIVVLEPKGGDKKTLKHPSGRDGIASLAYSPDGQYLVAGTHLNWLQVWSQSGELIKTLPGSKGAAKEESFTAAGYSLSGPDLFVAFQNAGTLWSSDGSGETRAWSFPGLNVESTRELGFPTSRIHSRAGQVGAVGARSFAQVWNQEQDRRLGGRADTVLSVETSEKSEQLALVTYTHVYLWDVAAGKPVRKFKGYAAAFSPDGSRFAVANKEGVRVFDSRGREVQSIPVRQRHRHRVNGLGFSPDSSRLAFAYEKTIQIWDRNKIVAQLEESRSVLDLILLADNTVLSSNPETIRQWDLRWKKMVLERKMPRGSYLRMATDGARLYAFSKRGGRVWSLNDIDAEPSKIKLGLHHEVSSLALSPDGRRLYLGTEDVIEVWNTLTMQKLPPLRGHLEGVLGMAHLNGKLLSASRDTSVRVWDGDQHLGQLVAFDDGEQWVVTSPNGLFDGSASGMGLLEWKVGKQYFALEQFFESAYTPGLLHRLLSGNSLSKVTSQAVAQPPVVRFLSPANGAVVENTKLDLSLDVKDQGSGWADLKLFHNGHRIGDLEGTSASVVLVPGLNRFRVTASSKDNKVESRADEIVVMCNAKVAEPAMHVIAVGIDKYDFPAPLEFAKKDAESIAKRLQPGVFSQIKVYSVSDKKATKEAIKERFSQVAQAAKPQDGCLVYLAGHGVTVEGKFYFLPSDAKLDSVSSSGLSSAELGELLSSISATKQVLFLDTCHSGATVGELAGVLAAKVSSAPVSSMVKDQHRLARNAGVFLVAASTPEAKAQEIPQLGHGLLTYTILSGLDESVGEASATPNAEGYVTMNTLLRFVSEQVPLLSEQYRGASQEVWQFSAGQDFALSRPR